jgi:hypothetical protein
MRCESGYPTQALRARMDCPRKDVATFLRINANVLERLPGIVNADSTHTAAPIEEPRTPSPSRRSRAG